METTNSIKSLKVLDANENYDLLVASEICFLKNFCHFHGIRRQFSGNEIRFEFFNRISKPEVFSGQKHRDGFRDVIPVVELWQKSLKS